MAARLIACLAGKQRGHTRDIKQGVAGTYDCHSDRIPTGKGQRARDRCSGSARANSLVKDTTLNRTTSRSRNLRLCISGKKAHYAKGNGCDQAVQATAREEAEMFH